MAIQYSQRVVRSVAVGPIMGGLLPDKLGVSATVTIELSAKDNPDMTGPIVHINVAIPFDASQATFHDAQKQLIEAAAAIIDRLSSETAETLCSAAPFIEPGLDAER